MDFYCRWLFWHSEFAPPEPRKSSRCCRPFESAHQPWSLPTNCRSWLSIRRTRFPRSPCPQLPWPVDCRTQVNPPRKADSWIKFCDSSARGIKEVLEISKFVAPPHPPHTPAQRKSPSLHSNSVPQPIWRGGQPFQAEVQTGQSSKARKPDLR